MQIRTAIALSAFASLTAGTASATVIGFENFDGGAVNLNGTTNVEVFGAAGGAAGDVFGIVTPFNGGAGTGGPFDVFDDSVVDASGGGVFPGDTLGLVGQNATGFFAVNDANGDVLNGLNDATWSFNISSALSITDITIDIAALGDFESASDDGFIVSAQIDGGGYQTIFEATTDDDGFKTYRPSDDGSVFADDDPLQLFIDGAPTAVGYLDRADASGAFDSYTSTLLAGQSGSTLDIRISWTGNPSGSEPQGFDNITINGVVPEPGSLALLALGGLMIARRRRG